MTYIYKGFKFNLVYNFRLYIESLTSEYGLGSLNFEIFLSMNICFEQETV